MNADNITSTPTPFARKLFNWKYLLPLLLIQGVLLYVYFNFPQGTNPLGLMVLVVLYLISRRVSTNAKGEKVRSWQWISFIVYLLITAALGVGILYATAKPATSGFDVQKYVNTLVKTVSSKVPLSAGEEGIVFKVTKKDNHSFIYHVRNTEYTRMEMLQSYHNNLHALQEDMLKGELGLYCHNTSVRNPIRAGVIIYEQFYGKQDIQPIFQLRIDESACRTYERG